jgi:hypothetical protein
MCGYDVIMEAQGNGVELSTNAKTVQAQDPDDDVTEEPE